MPMPLIGISGSLDADGTRVFLLRAYMEAVQKAGGIPVLLNPSMHEDAAAQCLDRLDGLLLAGGGDVVPARYEEEPIPEIGEQTPLRDEFELRIITLALERKLPTLGICRGVQIMNVALGGTLYQDLPAQYPARSVLIDHRQPKPYEMPTHAVNVQTNSFLFQLVAQKELLVNSMHHQAIKQLAPGLCATAAAPDGVLEALELADHPFFVGVQWHPERLTDTASARLFEGFVKAAACKMNRQ